MQKDFCSLFDEFPPPFFLPLILFEPYVDNSAALWIIVIAPVIKENVQGILFYFFASREYNAVCADGFDPLGFFQDTQSSKKENVEVIAVFSPPKFLGGHRCATE